MTEHIMIPFETYTEPQRRWVERTKSLVTRYLDSAYRPNEQSSRSLDSMFIHVAADVVWLDHPESPNWDQLDVLELVMRLGHAPQWDDTWLLHALASLSAFYRWLTQQQDLSLDRRALDAIEQDIESHIVECLRAVGMPGLRPPRH